MTPSKGCWYSRCPFSGHTRSRQTLYCTHWVLYFFPSRGLWNAHVPRCNPYKSSPVQVESRVAPQISGNDPHGFPNWPTLIPRLNARKKSHHQELTQLDTPALNQASVQVIYFRKKRHAFAIWYALQIQYLFFFWKLTTTCGVATHARIQHMLRADPAEMFSNI
jgi:hypothetical protein